MTPELQRLAAHPHTLTPPGTVVRIEHREGTFTVLAGWIAYQSGKRRNGYILRDSEGKLCASLNGWHVPHGWLHERVAELEMGVAELDDLEAALREVTAT